jgi:hypothetical protein
MHTTVSDGRLLHPTGRTALWGLFGDHGLPTSHFDSIARRGTQSARAGPILGRTPSPPYPPDIDRQCCKT